MLHVVKANETLSGIARQYRTTIEAIRGANVICNPDFLFVGQPLIIPEPNLILPKAGGTPYYVVFYGDSLTCLAQQFSKTAESLAQANELSDPNVLQPGSELLVRYDQTMTQRQLFELWNRTAPDCGGLTGREIMNNFYLNTFTWESLGSNAYFSLVQLLSHRCVLVRYFTVMSLGRIGQGAKVQDALGMAMEDPDPSVAQLAQHAMKRLRLAVRYTKRIHVMIRNDSLLAAPDESAASVPIASGTPIMVLRWFVPSPTGSGRVHTNPQIYDLVQVVETGQTGYLARTGFNYEEIGFL
ncbi:LysM peptidoglycan-binding domain-containing protein [Brevibacillus dissolubilis]|uniref:LysM peptidoglycan-binding domain-containing protein n=1 Tax=Brevibacillus dissolubilis TaxID=1844116 RepID=UPI0011171990|nr:LysM peptidoglycan-binding domain-containing protein [Brevibacillus dissolubilis]